MKKLLLLISAIILLSACEKDKSYDYHIGVENLTDTPLHFTLFTIKNRNIDYYISSSPYTGRNPFNRTTPKEFTLSPNSSEELFITKIEIIDPSFLITEIFDSIRIVTDSSLIIKFKPDQVENYQINIFTDNTNWSFWETEYDLKGNFGVIATQRDRYYNFTITNEGINK